MTDIETLCQRLQLAAMRCKAPHVSVDYTAHVDLLTVCVRSSNTDYRADIKDWPTLVMYRYVRLGADEAYGKLVAIVDELESMGVEV